MSIRPETKGSGIGTLSSRCRVNSRQTPTALATLSCFIFVARSDASFIRTTLPPLCKMAAKAECNTTVILDARNPIGVLGESLQQSELSEVIEILEDIKREYFFEIDIFSPNRIEVRKLSRIHFGKPYSETHCFRGYPIHGSIRQFHNNDSDYILHLDSDMLFHDANGFSWIQEGVRIMKENPDILCVLPKGGPPTNDGSLNQGTTFFQTDKKRGFYLFKNFTSRHYLIHRERFLSLLPLKPLWLSWRELIKSRLFGNGKMLCWETMVEHALDKSDMWRADLMTDLAWSLHPGDRSKEFYQLLPQIIDSVNRNEFPEDQRGHFDLQLNDWKHFLD